MNTYKYKATPIDGGKSVTGVVQAYSEYEAVAQIKARSLVVDKITELSEKKKGLDLNESLWVSDSVLALTASQFAIMLRAGLPMGKVVKMIADQTTDTLMKKILTACAEDVAAGYSLAGSLEKNGEKIPAAFIETVRAGEESGSLETCFVRLKDYYEKANRIKRKVKSAMTYPIILVLISVVVVAIVMVKLVPSMVGTFKAIGSDLPVITQILIGISDFFVNDWLYVLLGAGAIFLAYYLYKKTPGGALTLSKVSLRIPVMGKVSVMNAASQFANTMSVLLTAGLPITQVVTIVARVLDNTAVARTLDQAVAQLESGKRLGSALEGNPYLPEMLVEMVKVGEETGELEETMETIGAYYDEEADAASSKALSMLEPMMTIFLGVLVGFIVLAIYIPMFTMETTVVS